MPCQLPIVSFTQYQHSLGPQDMVLTRNNRQSTFLEHHWATQQADKALADPPAILPIQAWLNQLWPNLSDTVILSPTDALCMITDLIQNEDPAEPTDASALAKHILNGVALLSQWQLSLEDLALYQHEQNTGLFLNYASKFLDRLKQSNHIIAQEIPSRLIDLLENNNELAAKLPANIYLYGFVDINPSLEKLFTALNQHRPTVLVQMAQDHQPPQAKVFTNRAEELKQMAQWALQQHQTHPEKSILCVVPDLTKTQTDCLEAFLQYDPDALNKINISSGEPLNHTLIGQTALQFLNLKSYRTPLKTLAQCIQSALWLNDDIPTQIAKDRLASQLYEASAPILPLKQWLQPLTADDTTTKDLLDNLQAWLVVKTQKPKGKQSYQTWLEYFFAELNAIGWPGQQALPSIHYQQYQHLQKVWLDFLQLDQVLKPCNYETALQTLNLLCKQSLFAPESKNRPINVLGALEAHGLQSDAVWMCHCDAHTWPPTAKPNPLLPFSFQRKHTMPNACHLYTKDYYQTITKDILQSAKQVNISYAAWHDNLEQTASPFCQQFAFTEAENMTAEDKKQQASYFTAIDDLTGPGLTGKKIPGGSYGLQAQAQCPFQYFARYRLNLADHCEPAIGFEAYERGNVVHEALAYFYQQFSDNQTLESLSEQQRAQCIDNAIEHSLKHLQKNKLFIATEKQRLTLLLNQWLDFELKRPAFTIENIESTTQFSIHDFNLTMRLDRVDRLDDNSLLVMDYKTSQQASTQGWYDDRLTSPQIPLYVLALGQACQSATLALVKRGDPKFVGVSKNQTDIKGIRATDKDDERWQWPSLQDKWQQQVNNLAFEIKQGYAAVMPDPTSNPCQYCDCYLVCRVHHD